MDAAVKLPGQPVRRGSMPHEHDAYGLLADAAARNYDVAALRQYTPLVEALATRDAHPLYLAIAHRAQGVAARLAGDAGLAEAQLQRALGEFQQIGARWQTGRTWVELGELALARSEVEKARDYFGQALTAFEALQAKPDAARTRARLASLS